MSTHKYFDRICCVVLAVTLALTVLFVNAEQLGVQKASFVMGYEQKLFDTSKVHTINILMDDWDSFLASCQSEEYSNCTVVIDNDAYKNVAIRAKGNTSLTQVASYGNNRYSFKIEFDHYDSSNTYYGLDKLCLNNIIQDNTYMKDYLTYQMMAAMGVASPLCSYVYITVNGEDWGLYLAVEGVEESFLQRNYGKNYGTLYKPDSMSMGGGRGNGENFDIEEFFEKFDFDFDPSSISELQTNDTANADTESASAQAPSEAADGNMPQMPSGDGNMPQMSSGDGNMPQMPGGDNGSMPQMPGGDNGSMPQMPDGDNMPQMSSGDNMPQMPNSADDQNGSAPQMPSGDNMPQMPTGDNGSTPQMPGGDNGMGMMNSSDDVLLKYIDENPDSYSNIWDNAKTDISDSDKTRLITALKLLSEEEDLENTVDITAVISYFVVHNFVLNFDSYTGSMIHNYYLYEKDGQMQMIPWDYNLAFGGFQSSGSATTLANYPIDSPVSGGTVSDRPMIAWIFDNSEYTELYHQIFASFLADYFDNGYFEEMIDSLTDLITPYVEKDPTKFCTLDEFETGVSTLKEFCLLRAESIHGQLDGTIGSTSETQDSASLIDASDLQISDMGSMNNSMGGGMGAPGNFDFSKGESFLKNFMNTQKGDPTKSDATAESDQEDPTKSKIPENFAQEDQSASKDDDDSGQENQTASRDNENLSQEDQTTSMDDENLSQENQTKADDDASQTQRGRMDDHSKFDSPPDVSGNPMESAAPSVEALIELAICGLVLLIGLLTAGFYRRRR